MARVTAMVYIQFLAWEPPHARGERKKGKEGRKEEKKERERKKEREGGRKESLGKEREGEKRKDEEDKETRCMEWTTCFSYAVGS